MLTLFTVHNAALGQEGASPGGSNQLATRQNQEASEPAAEDAAADAPATPQNITPPADEVSAGAAALQPPSVGDSESANSEVGEPRTSGYQPPASEPLPEISGPPRSAAAAAGPVYKMVFSGCYGRFHLIDKIGTAHYSLGGAKHLALLRYDKADLKYTYYFAELGDPFAAKWAFSRVPDAPGQYSVWRLTRQGWKLYDLAHVSRPR